MSNEISDLRDTLLVRYVQARRKRNLIGAAGLFFCLMFSIAGIAVGLVEPSVIPAQKIIGVIMLLVAGMFGGASIASLLTYGEPTYQDWMNYCVSLVKPLAEKSDG